MSDDYPVKSRSDAEIHEIAERWLRGVGLENAEWIDVVACLKSPMITTIRGEKRLFLHVVPDAELRKDALTTYGNGTVTIWVRQSVYDRADAGVGRDRFTLAHELGHVVLHEGAPKARSAAGEGAKRPKWIKPFESAERQANRFASGVLINDTIANALSSAVEISNRFGVSVAAAEVYFEALLEKRNRVASAERVARLAEQFVVGKPAVVQPHYLETPCPVCEERTVAPVGSKYLCANCGTIIDRLQDGDPGI